MTTQQQPSLQAINILLVEDNAGDARLIELMLEDMSSAVYCLQVVSCLRDAEEILHQESFDVLIMDMSLPDGEGLDNISRVKSIVPDIPVVVISGQYADEDIALDAVKSGAQDYLIKNEINEWHLNRSLKYAIERKRLQNDVYKKAHYDHLTGLANRQLFLSRLEHALSCAERRDEDVALLYMDLDHFKPVNDGLGHDMGDKLLIQVAERLRGTVREMDTVARLGGDEFALILEGVSNVNNVACVADKIIQAITQVFQIDEHALYIGVSIGIAIYPQGGKTPGDLIKNADNAMYRAKAAGRNTFKFYTSQMNQDALNNLHLGMHLRKALMNDEFLLHYQPKFEIQSQKLCGNEALIRWNHPDRGLLYPNTFIPQLEKMGMISEVGKWVIETVCRQHAEWSRQGLVVGKVAINLSGKELTQSDFPSWIYQTLKKSSMDPQQLEVELTENLLIQNTQKTIQTFAMLKDMGISIAIDDFGTGYSSLNYLKRFMFDTLKIDRSFIEDITHDNTEAAITKAIIQLAKDLGIDVVAEGVETKEQMDFLQDLDIDVIQGYYISPPVSSLAYSKLITPIAA